MYSDKSTLTFPEPTENEQYRSVLPSRGLIPKDEYT